MRSSAATDAPAVGVQNCRWKLQPLAARLLPPQPADISGEKVRGAVWDLQSELTEERDNCVRAVCASLAAVYPDAEPHLVQDLGRRVCVQFQRERFATKKELGELKKLAADASALFPPEFALAEPRQIKQKFRQQEAAHKSSTQA